jgi:hypothetical protein
MKNFWKVNSHQAPPHQKYRTIFSLPSSFMLILC